MKALATEYESWMPEMGDDWRHPLEWRRKRREPHVGLLIAGVAVVGLGLLTWHYLGPDTRRYLKIHAM